MTHKKQIVLDFYSCHNLGDDLFVETFAKHFSDCIIADCTDHHRYAVNQFSGLESYLNEKESAIESSIV